MADIPIGSHLFSPEALTKVLSETVPPPKPGQKGQVVGAVDSTGAKVALVLTPGNGDHWQIEAAFAHDWAGDNSVGGKIIYSF